MHQIRKVDTLDGMAEFQDASTLEYPAHRIGNIVQLYLMGVVNRCDFNAQEIVDSIKRACIILFVW